MLTCSQCQTLLLDRQYGLLDATDDADLAAHLAGCPTCQAEQLKVERFQRLLSTAARSEFPDVRFVAPQSGEVTPAGHAARPSQSSWRIGWLVAAAVLLALGIPAGTHLATTYSRQHQLDAAVQHEQSLHREFAALTSQHSARMGEAVAADQRAREQVQELQTDLTRKLTEAENNLREKQINVVITGPKTLQAGAPNEYRIETLDTRNRPAPATLSFKLKDQQDRVVHEEKALRSNGATTLKLPADLPLTPGRDLTLDLVAQAETGPRAELRESLHLAGSSYITHLTTDKPLYQPGETVYFRSLTLDRATLKPATESLNIQFVVRNPQGAEMPIVAGNGRAAGANGQPLTMSDNWPVQGVGAGQWQIPPVAPGGEYTLAVRDLTGRSPEEQRKFLVNRYQPARLNKELEWSRKSFGPGDLVVANCKITRAEGGPVANQPVKAEAFVDGQPVPVTPPGSTDAQGNISIKLTLPTQIERGVASLTVTLSDGGSVESLVKPIPVVLNKLLVDFYPEGGDLVAGVHNRVYFQVRTTLDKPADLHGQIVDSTGQIVADVETLTDDREPGINQGMGRFEFTPEIRQTYKLVIDNPANIQGEHKLPEVKVEGVVFSTGVGVSGDADPLRVRVHNSGVARSLLVGAYARGRLLDHRRINVPANDSADVELKPEAGVGGVTRVTVFEELAGDGANRALRPIAERLVFRKPAKGLTLTAKPDKDKYVPGDKVQLHLSATNEKGEPVPAVGFVGVVNQSVVTMADEKTLRALPTHFLLTSEVQRPEELEHADVLLGDHPKAAAALDLLLGTQGWRRFAEQKGPGLRDNRAEADERILVAIGQPSNLMKADAFELARKKVAETVQPDVDTAQRRLEEANRALAVAQADPDYVSKSRQVGESMQSAWMAVQKARTELSETEAWRRQVLGWLLPAACGVFLVVTVVVMVIGLWRGVRYYAAAAGALGATAVAALMLALHVSGVGDENQVAMRMQRDAGVAATPAAAMMPEAPKPMAMEGAPFGGAKNAAADRAMPAPAVPPPPPAPAAAALQPARTPVGAIPLNELGANVIQGRDAADRKAGEALQGQLIQDLNVDRQLRRLGAPDAAGLNPGINFNPAAGGGVNPPGDAGVAGLGGLGGFGGGFNPPGGGGGGGGRGGRGKGGGPPAGFAGGRVMAPPPPSPFLVREYAHRHTASPGGDRTDFAETVFWHPVLVMPKDGATVSFDLSDAVTRYRILTAANTPDGRLGALTTQFEARKPLTLEPKLPVEITAGDRVDVPLTIANDTDSPRTINLQAQPQGLTLVQGNFLDKLTLTPQQRTRRVYSFQPSIPEGTAELSFAARGDGPALLDGFRTTLPVAPEGFPVVGTVSDVIENTVRHEIVLPETWVKGTLKCQVNVFPSTLAELQKGLEGLLREPGGCFEQTSTTNYPNTLIVEYLKESDQANPDALRKAREMLSRGYAKLTSFEVPQNQKREGFEWFGQAPAHEALTAYGLMQFRDMARVSDVDPTLLQRTRDYLLARRDGKGGFQRNSRALDTFGRAPDDVTNAYIIWGLTESGKDDDVTRELNQLAEQAKTSNDPYFLALVANCLLNRDRADEAAAILTKLAASLTKDGFLDGARTSITGSTGRMLHIETTALAVLGWLKAGRAKFLNPARTAVAWIGKQRGGYGGFGSTQSTILALKALIAYTKANKKTAEAGELRLIVGDRTINMLAFAAGAQNALTVAIPNADLQLKPGKNEVRVEMTGKNTFPYTLTWSYQTLQPPSAEGCAVRLTTALDRPEMDEGDSARLNVRVENVSGKGQGMAVAVIGLPAGLKLPDDFQQLRDLARLRDNGTKSGVIGAFEVRGRELVLYWRDLAPDAKIDLSLDLRGHVPGVYRGPASRAYLYYDPDAKHWTTPLAATIKAKQ